LIYFQVKKTLKNNHNIIIFFLKRLLKHKNKQESDENIFLTIFFKKTLLVYAWCLFLFFEVYFKLFFMIIF